MDVMINSISFGYEEDKLYDNFSMTFKEHHIVGLFGASGCGKTTLLNLCAGLIPLDSGTIKGINPQKISYIFQEPRLLPWKTVEDNLNFVLPEDEKNREKVKKVLKMVHMYDHRHKYPRELSGGMKQRVSIARAFVYNSELLLMDEPFQGLDDKLKQEIIADFKALWALDKRTVLYVSHDIEEMGLMTHEIYQLSGLPLKASPWSKENHEIH
jgi:NitT/TauT family transport system ATP-binding protein